MKNCLSFHAALKQMNGTSKRSLEQLLMCIEKTAEIRSFIRATIEPQRKTPRLESKKDLI